MGGATGTTTSGCGEAHCKVQLLLKSQLIQKHQRTYTLNCISNILYDRYASVSRVDTPPHGMVQGGGLTPRYGPGKKLSSEVNITLHKA